MSSTKPCPNCGGSGDPLHVRTDAHWEPSCPTCNGSGVVEADTKPTCCECNGTGNSDQVIGHRYGTEDGGIATYYGMCEPCQGEGVVEATEARGGGRVYNPTTSPRGIGEHWTTAGSDTEPRPEDCYCSCHSLVSSRPSCEHCQEPMPSQPSLETKELDNFIKDFVDNCLTDWDSPRRLASNLSPELVTERLKPRLEALIERERKAAVREARIDELKRLKVMLEDNNGPVRWRVYGLSESDRNNRLAELEGKS